MDMADIFTLRLLQVEISIAPSGDEFHLYPRMFLGLNILIGQFLVHSGVRLE